MSAKIRPFSVEFNKVILANLFNDYADNHDPYRFGPEVTEAPKRSVKDLVKHKLKSRGIESVRPPVDQAIKFVNEYSDRIGYFNYLYDLLADDYSRDLLLKVCAYRILGKKKIKLPMNNPHFWNTIREIEKAIVSEADAIDTGFMKDWKLYRHDLSSFGYPLQLYMRSIGIYYDFIYKGYFYEKNGVSIKVEEGDHVIDGGACYGDTALFFAHHAGKKGRVYSFEFVNDNIRILEKNASINPELHDRIQLVAHPLWSSSGVPVFYESNGPATNVSMNKKISDKSFEVPTASIDDLVGSGKIEKVDFIKMDIEGAEVEALKGAIKTITKFKPKLAICLYHRESDFQTIPEFIKSLDLGYRFYFNHYTMHAEESVLFCKA
jgi:FkbM family methyltransferase